LKTNTKPAPNQRRVFINTLRKRAFAPVDIASLVFFRIAFGLLMVGYVWGYFSRHWIAEFWIEPRFLFKYYGFSWIHPWPGHGLYIHWAAMGLFALFIATGFLYRASARLFFLSYTYFFLLDETRYQNHTYLICLFGFLLIFLPADRGLSVDTWLRPQLRSDTTPAWTIWLLRAQMGIVYFYGGIAKIAPDWLRGEPMRLLMAHSTDFPIIGRFFREEWAVYTMSYGALLFDLIIVPLLLWHRTSVVAFCAAIAFHLINARLFSIGVFPWFAIAATTLFLSPGWPRRVVSIFRGESTLVSATDPRVTTFGRNQIAVLALLSSYLAVQILLPLTPFLFPGGSEWIYMQHRFSWRMMLRYQSVQGYFYVTDPNIDATYRVDPRQFLSPSQSARIYWQPDMVLQFAHYLATVLPRAGPKPLNVEARLFVSINGRRPELFVDPNVDLTAQSRPLMGPTWLLPTHEPLPPHGTDLSEDPFGPQAHPE
jgi:vitamin K-dependent gamma-carboxylase